jgi:hypothetical protein
MEKRVGSKPYWPKVAGNFNAIHVVFYDLLRVLSQTSQVGMELFGVLFQESIHVLCSSSTDPLSEAASSALHCLSASQLAFWNH